jgi:hypothetical protein
MQCKKRQNISKDLKIYLPMKCRYSVEYEVLLVSIIVSVTLLWGFKRAFERAVF